MKYLISLIIVSLSLTAYCQQDIILTNNTYNNQLFNPAVAGSEGYKQGSVFVSYRDQWIGLEGSPKTQLIGANYNLFDDRVGLGATLSRETIGIDSRIDLQTNYAYRIKFDQNQYLSLGMRLGIHLYDSELAAVNYTDSVDPIYDSGVGGFNVITTGLGAYYESESFGIGISVPAIASISNANTDFKTRHFYLHTKYAFYLSQYSDFKIEPSILIKYEPAAPVQYTFATQFFILPQFAVGFAYRSQDAFALTSQFIIDKTLSLGVAFDFNTSELNTENNGSIEFIVGYKINNDDNDPFR